MKIKSYIAIGAGFITYIALHYFIMGYENTKAHKSLNFTFVEFLEEFVKKEAPDWIMLELSDDFLGKLKGPGVTNSGYFENTTSESTLELSPQKWIEHGGFSADEPEIPASVRHFYDPLGLKDGKKYLTNRGTYWEGVYPNPGIDAIEWALGDTPKGEGNEWSAKAGKDYFIKAIEEANENLKEEYLAKAWRCFGEVLHNTADMACPPHVRNDSHAAPFGWTGGWVMGSPDAYEEMFNPDWVKDYYKNKPDPQFWESIQEVSTIREVQEKLAKFTNANFFSHETISGMGVKKIKPSNGEAEYPSPKLENLEYDEESFTYYKTFPSGRRIKMCKDHSYFNFRGYPYIDMDCAKSQASELIPNFMWAALKIFVLYAPPLSFYIDRIETDGKLIGVAKTALENKEYKDVVNFNGSVDLFVGSKYYKVACNNGEFEKTLPLEEINAVSSIHARISLGGIIFNTPKFVQENFSHLKQFELNLQTYLINSENKEELLDEGFESEKGSMTWNANKGYYSESEDDDYHSSNKSLAITMSFDGYYIDNLVYTSTIVSKSIVNGFDLSDKYEITYELKNVNSVMYFNSTFKYLLLFETDFKKVLQNIYYKETIKSGKYNDKSEIIGVTTEVREYKKLAPSSSGSFNFMLQFK